jgi:hypothetical protein
MAIIANFPAVEKPRVEPETPAAILSARVAVGVKRAAAVMCAHVSAIDHAGKQAETVAMLAILEVVGRAASDPDTTVNQLLQALWEQVPEDTRIAADGGSR